MNRRTFVKALAALVPASMLAKYAAAKPIVPGTFKTHVPERNFVYMGDSEVQGTDHGDLVRFSTGTFPLRHWAPHADSSNWTTTRPH